MSEMNGVAFNVIIREWVLGETFMVTACMVVVFVVFVFLRARDLDYRIFSVEFYSSDWTRAAIGLITFLTGVSLRAVWVWMLLWSYERYGKTGIVEGWWPLDIVAGALTIVGGLCIIREFTPADWNKWALWRRPWVMCLILTSIFLVAANLPLYGGYRHDAPAPAPVFPIAPVIHDRTPGD